MNRTKLSGWKRLAASLVLLPGLSAVGAEMLHLLGTAQAEQRPAVVAENEWAGDRPERKVRATSEDPRVLLKKAKDALDGGNLDKAQDLARQAESNGRNASWGLFEDNPSSMLKDIQKARGKRDRNESDKLLAQARGLYERRTSTEEQRAANLDKARGLCLQAAKLHGPYSMWDFGDRPQSLVKDIDAARSRIAVAGHKVDPKANEADPFAEAMETRGVGESDTKPGGYNPIRTNVEVLPFGPAIGKNETFPKPIAKEEMNGYVLPDNRSEPKKNLPLTAATQANARKTEAVKHMQHASACMRGGKFVEARQSLTEAQKQGASFSPNEETPEMAMQLLMSAAHEHINELCRGAQDAMQKKSAAEVAKAEAKLNEAEAVAAGLGLDRWAISEHRIILRGIQAKVSVNVNVSQPLPSDGIPTAVVLPAEASADLNVAAKPFDQGMEMLKQAHVEIQQKSLDTARKIAVQVLNGPYSCKNEAQDLLRTIDAAELAQRKHAVGMSFQRGVDAYQRRDYAQALSVFKLVDPTMLPMNGRRSMTQMMDVAAKSLEKPSGLMQAGGPGPIEPLAPAEKGGADSLLKQQEAMMELQFQKLRSEGLQVESGATARFGKGETDAAMQDMNNFIAKVKSSNIDPSKVALLTRPIENRIERLKVLKHQQDFLTKEARNLKDFRSQTTQDALSSAHKKESVARLMKDYQRLTEEGKWTEAGKVAMQAHELDPEDPTTQAAMNIARMRYRKKAWQDGRDNTEIWNFEQGNENFNLGPPATLHDPLKMDVARFNEIKNRPDYSNGILNTKTKSEKVRQIESKLSSKEISLKFKDTPLDEVVAYFASYSGMNFDLDTKALKNEGIDPGTPITATLTNITMKSALDVVLLKANLRYVVDKEVVRVTTQKGARGDLQQRTIQVADLVVPIQNFTSSPIADLETQLQNTIHDRSRSGIGATSPYSPPRGLTNGSSESTGSPSPSGPNRLVNSPVSPIVSRNLGTATIEESLIHLITNSIKPDTWESMGGPGRIEYYPLGMALVINQTPDVIEQVLQLLESLRQLQDLEVAIEVRMITLAESFYERIGLDFSLNIKTGNNESLSLVQGAGNTGNNTFGPLGKLVGLQAPGIPTPDLSLPIKATSFGPSVPPFGGFPNALGADGGLSLGLAFLSDIQVQMFLEAAQGDRRTNVMQAPKLTMFNGQAASLSVQDQQFFMTGVDVTSVNGVLVFTPENRPFPLGVNMNLQPVVTGDRRFVRLSLTQRMTNLASANVPLFPITTIVTPVFEGGAQGQPIPFTQFVQQPTFSTITVNTTVLVPDGGTVLLGGLKTLSEGRNEFGPPVLSKIPYINRLFRNVGYGRDAQSLLMMVTPRIIINREEQEKQTGVFEQPGEDNR